MPSDAVLSTIAAVIIGLILVLWPRAVIRLPNYLWIRSGEPSESGVAFLRFFGIVLLGTIVLFWIGKTTA